MLVEKEPGKNPSFDSGPIDELRSNADSGEENLRVFGRALKSKPRSVGSRSEPSIPSFCLQRFAGSAPRRGNLRVFVHAINCRKAAPIHVR